MLLYRYGQEGAPSWLYYMFGYTTYYILKTIFGPQRAADFRLRARHRKSNLTKDVICLCISIGAIIGLFLSFAQHYHASKVEAKELPLVNSSELPLPREVRIEARINWTPERIEKEIRDTFPEDADRAVAIVMSEGGLVTEKQSQIVKDGIQEPSFCAFQIHKPSWDIKAKKLGYGDYKTNVQHCVKMARYIYDSAGGKWTDWSAYNNGSYKKYMVY